MHATKTFKKVLLLSTNTKVYVHLSVYVYLYLHIHITLRILPSKGVIKIKSLPPSPRNHFFVVVQITKAVQPLSASNAMTW